MTRLEYDALSAVRDGSISRMADAVPDTQTVLTHLAHSGLLRVWMGGKIIITPQGVAALAAFEEMCKQRANEEAAQAEKEHSEAAQAAFDKRQQRKHDYAVAAFSAAFGVLLTLLCQNADRIVHALCEWVRGLFH